jgi:hypothetical protein
MVHFLRPKITILSSSMVLDSEPQVDRSLSEDRAAVSGDVDFLLQLHADLISVMFESSITLFSPAAIDGMVFDNFDSLKDSSVENAELISGDEEWNINMCGAELVLLGTLKNLNDCVKIVNLPLLLPCKVGVCFLTCLQ